MKKIVESRMLKVASNWKCCLLKHPLRHLELKWILPALAVLIFAAIENRAQQTPGGFSSVEYYGQPNQTQMKSKLSGMEAQPLPGGLLVIKQLKLETFNTNGSPQAIVEAPECVYDTRNNTASSAGHLQLQSGDGKIRVEGDGFLWRQDDSFLNISNHVRTVIETSPEMNIGL
jgi:hypothetical protein